MELDKRTLDTCIKQSRVPGGKAVQNVITSEHSDESVKSEAIGVQDRVLDSEDQEVGGIPLQQYSLLHPCKRMSCFVIQMIYGSQEALSQWNPDK